ncbi:TITAN9 family protein [Melia azedarach]|uniref:TITAN9 family protein n=1 Tax=Melia azedarach TaxID=155640 RepID=A0ACC1YKR8_MELAZ|nr:TITAN9 family protein [Melia azedarach]
MESLYGKLYEKYDKLKKKKLGELDEINKEQELKFLSYVSAAEELIEYLRSENDKLHAQVNNLRSEANSIRSTNNEQCVEYQKLLMEENQKNKALSEEVERLQKLLQEGISTCSKDGKNDNMQLNSPEGAPTTSRSQSSGKSKGMRRKRSREFEAGSEVVVTPGCSGQDKDTAGEAAKDISKETVSNGTLAYDQLPECCKRTFNTSGGAEIDSGPANCLFQALVEYLVGMKLSTFNQTEGTCISALHQSSGYSFSLTWIRNEAGEECELLYRVVSLGTFERVAPEWMRDVLIFSMNMCPIFFERIARVIKLHH